MELFMIDDESIVGRCAQINGAVIGSFFSVVVSGSLSPVIFASVQVMWQSALLVFFAFLTLSTCLGAGFSRCLRNTRIVEWRRVQLERNNLKELGRSDAQILQYFTEREQERDRNQTTIQAASILSNAIQSTANRR